MGQPITKQNRNFKNEIFTIENDVLSFKKLKVQTEKQQKFQISKQSEAGFEQATSQFGGYEKLSLVNCNVNIFALKYLINKNKKYLKHIIIDLCKFYLTDEDATLNKKQASNQRMLSEVNFVHMIEQFQLISIQYIDIMFNKTQLMSKEREGEFSNSNQIRIEEQSLKNNTKKAANDDEKLMKIFNCQKDCKFLQYETILKQKFEEQYISEQKMKELTEDLIWGKLKKKEVFLQKLDQNSLNQIEESLTKFKKYSKHSFEKNRLIIHGSSLYCTASIKQLYNQILLNGQFIEAIIFKDNRKIPNRIFRDLLKKLSKINSLKELAFINSTIDEENIMHLRYLILKLKIKYLILYKSYFLQPELDLLINKQLNEPSHQINQFRFSLIDLQSKQLYEFSQYQFEIDSINSKSNDKIILQEDLFLQQSKYPKKIQKIISNYQGKNVAILQKDTIDKILFNYFQYLHNTKSEMRELKQIQDDLIVLLQEQLIQDDINELNYSLIKKLIKFVQEKELQIKFEESMKQCKSYKLLQEKYILEALEKQTFNNNTQLQIKYSYLHGFTNIKDNIDYLILLEASDIYTILYNANQYNFDQQLHNNSSLSSNASINQQDLKSRNFFHKFFMYLNNYSYREYNTEKLVDIISSNIQIDNLIINVGVTDKINGQMSKKIFYETLQKLKNIKSFQWYDRQLDTYSIDRQQIKIDNKDLEEFKLKLNSNSDINNFYETLHNAYNLTKMSLFNLQFSKKQFEQFDRSIFPVFLSSLEIETKVVENAQYINSVFQSTSNLNSLTFIFNIADCEFIKEIQLPYFLKEINLTIKGDSNFNYILVQLGLRHSIWLESLSLKGFNMLGEMPQKFNKYLQGGMLQGYENLKKLYLNCKIEDENFINLVLNNINFLNKEKQNKNISINNTSKENQDYVKSYFQNNNENQNTNNSQKQRKQKLYQSGLKSLTLLECFLNQSQLINLNLQNQYESLKILNLSRSRKVDNFVFLNNIFENCKKLKVLDLSYSNINDEKFKNVNLDIIPNSLENLILSGNFQIQKIDAVLNKIFKRCKIKVLHLRDCNIDDDKINNLEFNTLAKTLISIDLCNNSELFDFSFLNHFYDTDNKLESIYLPRNIEMSYLKFEQWRKNLKVLDIDKSASSKFKSDHFKSYLHQKLEYSFDYLQFKKRYCQKLSDQFFNEHEEFKFANLSDLRYQQIRECFNLKNYDDNITNEKKKSITENTINTSLDVQYSQHVHPFYFYPFFKLQIQQQTLNINSDLIQNNNSQLIEQNDKSLNTSYYKKVIIPTTNQDILQEIKRTETLPNQKNNDIESISLNPSNEQKKIVQYQSTQSKQIDYQIDSDSFIKEQNIFLDQEYSTANFFNEYYSNTILSKKHQAIINSIPINSIIIKNQVRNIEFLPQLIERSQNIQKIDFTGSNLFFESILQNKIKQPLLHLQDLNLSNMECKSENQTILINEILKNSPNLLKLNLSNTNMNSKRCCDLNLISSSLQFLDISQNRFPSLNIFNDLFLKCKEIRVLRLNNICLNINLCDKSLFKSLSYNLQELYCQFNNFNDSDAINDILIQSQNLTILNLSYCEITDQTNQEIKYDQISPKLQNFNFDKNYINETFYKFYSFRERCPHLKIFNITYQRNFDDSNLAKLLKQIPSNLDNLIKTNLENQVNVLIIEKLDNSYYCSKQLNMEHSTQQLQDNQSINLTFDTDFGFSSFRNSNQGDEFYIIKKKIYYLFNKYKSEKRWLINTIKNKIKELDLSQNYDLNKVHMECINQMKENEHLETFKAHNTNLTNQLISELQTSLLFTNLRYLDISSNYNIKSLEFLNQVFNTAVHLYYLDISNLQITQDKISTINFTNIPQSLSYLNVSLNYMIKDFSFLNSVFLVTKNTLRYLLLQECDLKQEKLKEVNFQLISMNIQVIDFSKNPNLNQMSFLYPLFNKNPYFILDSLILNDTSCDLFEFLSKYREQVNTIKYGINQFYPNCSNRYKVFANLELLFINSLSKTLKSEREKNIFKVMCLNMKKIKEFKQFNVYQHLLINLLHSDNSIKYPQYNKNFLIMSPFSIAQEIHKIEDSSIIQQSEHEENDNFNILLIDFCILNNQTDYIFAYDKFFFQDYPDFYFQDIKQNKSSIQFALRLQKKMLFYKIKQAFLPIRIICSGGLLQELQQTELDFLQCLNMVPPSEIKLSNVSIQFVKSWYAINYYSPLTVSTHIDINYSLLENSSVANFFGNYFYQIFIRNFKASSFKDRLKSYTSKKCYTFLQLFNSQPQRYRFDHSIIQLEELFQQQQKKYYYILLLIYPIYIITCALGVFLISNFNDIKCGQGISWYSYFCYALFGIITLIFEAYFFNITLRYVSHLIPELNTDCKQAFI